jgi:hypothetical protein
MPDREPNGSTPTPVLNTDEVLSEEANAIHGDGSIACGLHGPGLYRELNKLGSTALCLSGGGIRSASFSLGVIEALARHPRPAPDGGVASAQDSLLCKFQYLSTVSGGGYLGSFLSAWLTREHLAGPNGWAAVWEKLAGKRSTPDEEPTQLAWLRTYSNYLTPKLGVASADAWAAVAIYLRNLMLNWLVILPVVCALLLFLKFVALAVAWFSQFDARDCELSIISLVLGAACLVVALRFTNRERPTHGASRAGQGSFLWQDLGFAFASAIFFVWALAFPCAEHFARNALFSSASLSGAGVSEFAAAGAALYAIGWIVALPQYSRWKEFVFDLTWWTISGAAYGALMAFGVYLYFYLSEKGVWHCEPMEILLLICGVPWIFLSQLVAEMIFLGLSSYENGSDSDREWFARAAGWYLVFALCWLLVMFLVFIGSAFANGLYAQISTWLLGGGAGAVTALLGKSSLTPAKGPTKDRKGLSANVALAIAAPVVAAALVVGLSALLDQALFGKSLVETASFHNYVAVGVLPPWLAGIWILIAFAIVILVGAIASSRVNINRFSLHALYRNRIIRAFLGASNPDRARTKNLFTDFDENDNLRIYDLWPQEISPGVWPKVGSRNWRPFHIINMALNIVSTKRLAWQERKAESFTVSALHSGSSCLKFRYSTTYGDSQGISLGTAVAISGAAASPNMGYHSSAPLALLLTLFNVRLGWWLGNPGPAGDRTYKNDAPLGRSNPFSTRCSARRPMNRITFIYPTGATFENLGLYEMVRRRCRYILVVDAGCDKEFAFEDLGNAVRKISLDLGIMITFKNLDSLAFRERKKAQYAEFKPPFHAVGTIDYPSADGGGLRRTILYIKPAFHARRITNVGVRNYAVSNPDFPHQTTADQWFSESQFESYRALGFDSMDAVLNQIVRDPNCPPNPTLPQIFATLQRTI